MSIKFFLIGKQKHRGDLYATDDTTDSQRNAGDRGREADLELDVVESLPHVFAEKAWQGNVEISRCYSFRASFVDAFSFGRFLTSTVQSGAWRKAGEGATRRRA
ncbi:hypothetical protein ABZP36_015904 [Zizania latifolia]